MAVILFPVRYQLIRENVHRKSSTGIEMFNEKTAEGLIYAKTGGPKYHIG